MMPDSSYETVTRTDWNVDSNIPRPYWRMFYNEILNKYIERLNEFYEVDGFEIANSWYQQYSNDSEHIWHRHGQTNFTNVYFLELPDKEHRTEIKDVEYDAEEGDLITFPAAMLHRSKPSQGRKTVISFNLNFS